MLGVPGDLGGEIPLVTEPHVPIDVVLARLVGAGGRIDLLMDVEQADALVAVVAALRPGHLADAAVADRPLGLPIAVVGGGVGADLQHFLVTADLVAQLDRLLDRVRHRLFAVDMLARFERIAGDLGVPVVGRGDQHGVDIVTLEDFAIVAVTFRLRDRLGPRDSPPINVADGDDLDVVGLGPLHQPGNVTGPLPADADHSHANAIIGADCRRRRQTGHRHGSGRRHGSPNKLSTRKVGFMRHGRTSQRRCRAGSMDRQQFPAMVEPRRPGKQARHRAANFGTPPQRGETRRSSCDDSLSPSV